jgi:hypothetical protein
VNSEIRLLGGYSDRLGSNACKADDFGLPPIADLTCGLVGRGHRLTALFISGSERQGSSPRSPMPRLQKPRKMGISKGVARPANQAVIRRSLRSY